MRTGNSINQPVETQLLHLSKSLSIFRVRNWDVRFVVIEADGAFVNCGSRPMLTYVDTTLTNQQNGVRCKVVDKEHVLQRMAPL